MMRLAIISQNEPLSNSTVSKTENISAKLFNICGTNETSLV